MLKALITAVPFAAHDDTPLQRLKQANIHYQMNPVGRTLKENELLELIGPCDVLLAGTEPITNKVMAHAPSLKLIARVGAGLDNIDLTAASQRSIRVTYTPDAPAEAVSELTLGLMIALLRQVPISNAQLHRDQWRRLLGRSLNEVTVGLIGIGRIGSRVLAGLQKLGCQRILANDIRPNHEWTSKEHIYSEADVISLHVPLTQLTKNMIALTELWQMKQDALLINTARGGIINEQDLYAALQAGHLGGVALDVYETEPYQGPFSKIDRCLLTAHMGSMSFACRSRMELDATNEAIRFLSGQELRNEATSILCSG